MAACTRVSVCYIYVYVYVHRTCTCTYIYGLEHTHTHTHSHALSSLCLPIEEAQVQVRFKHGVFSLSAFLCCYHIQIAREADSLTLCPGTWFGLLSSPWVVSHSSINSTCMSCMPVQWIHVWLHFKKTSTLLPCYSTLPWRYPTTLPYYPTFPCYPTNLKC